MADSLTPDPGEVFRAFASSRSAITVITGTRISLTLTGDEPAIRYAWVGGRHDGGSVLAPLLQVECWGRGGGAPDDGTSSVLARTVLSLVPEFVGEFGDGWSAGATATAPFAAPDPETHRPRHIVQIRPLTHALI